MHPFEFVIIIVLVVTIGRIIERRYTGRGHAGRKHDGNAGRQAPAQDEMRLDALEERVQVLERIVTDQGYELRQKFRDLER